MPHIVQEFTDEDWKHIVREDFRLDYFYHLDRPATESSRCVPKEHPGTIMNANSESKTVSARHLRPFAVKVIMKPEQACAVGLAMLVATSSLAASVKSPLADAAEKSDRAGVRTLLK